MNRIFYHIRLVLLSGMIIFGILCLIGTGGSGSGSGGTTGENGVARSALPYDDSPAFTPADQQALVSGLIDFTFDFFHQLEAEPDMDDKNIFFSSYSIINALAMTWAGAENDTAAEMADALGITLSEEAFHPALNGLNIDLNSRDDQAPWDGDAFQLNLVNAVWSQDGYPLLPAYLDTLATHYDAGVRLLDFYGAPDESRQTINQWVEEQTNEKIINLLPPGSITSFTVLVLTNAIYFKASWHSAFEENATTDQPFTCLDDSIVTVPMMRQRVDTRFYRDDLFDAVELPYVSAGYAEYEYPLELSMLVIIPKDQRFEAVSGGLDADQLKTIVAALSIGDIMLSLPKFTFEFEVSCKKIMMDLGMTKAFDPNLADFSGMADPAETAPWIDDIYHKAFIAVDEEGTEAAAATAVVMAETTVNPDPIVISADRPFIFLIRDSVTNAVLFMGRVIEPQN